MISLIAFAVRLGVPARFAKVAVIAALATMAWLAVIAAFKLHDRRVVADHDAKQAAETMRAERKANDQAASERASDTIAITKHEQETRHAVEAASDQPIAPTSRALACERLRNAGRVPPACR